MKSIDYTKVALQKIAEIQNKVELKSETVELGIAQDFEKKFNDGIKMTTSAYNGQFEIEKAIDKMLKDYDAAGKTLLRANSHYQELEGAFKSLGVPMDSKYEGYKKAISDTLKEIDAASKNLLKAKSMSFV